ncbi:hypothetical protein DEI92_07655 [Curtobacterium sp. MCBD17_034]|uniref:glycosyltransferase family 2 protein n=1 Tax=unclassified Curtobacterium TaxID=257496 RepID=UPI000DA6F8A0|nr:MULTISPECIES: glycosyltransferase [unclassified Curtobacterium]PZF60234.1 hypothetical protein DEI92_07655 [Curtobacterium sp. MCBD17_034]PZM34919.1 hypothetical protein DEI90_05640 [Curtobacterium sp. MCBD17_031]
MSARPTDAVPDVTVVAALFRPGRLLDGFLGRAAALLTAGVELVLVDDGSGDGTAERLRRWAVDRPDVQVLENATNSGVAASRNRAVRLARGTWVWFVDHDDRWEPGAPTRLLDAATDDVDLVVCRADFRTDPLRPGRIVDGVPVPRVATGPEALVMLLEGTIDGFLWSKLVRRSVLGDAPFPHLPSQSDVAGLAPVLAAARRVRFVPDVLYHWVHRPGSVSRSRTPALDALEAAHAAVVAATDSVAPVDAPALADPARREELLTWFTCWFRCRALVVTPGRQHAPWSVRRAGVRRARRALHGRRLGGVRLRSTSVWLLMWTVRVAPLLVVGVLPLLFAVHDARVAGRSRG